MTALAPFILGVLIYLNDEQQIKVQALKESLTEED